MYIIYTLLNSSNNNDWIPMIVSPVARQRQGDYQEDNMINAGGNEVGSFAFPTDDGAYAFEYYPNANTNKKNIPPTPSNYDNYYPYPVQQKQEQEQQQHHHHRYTQSNKFPSFNSNLNSNLPNVPGSNNYRKTTYQQNYPNYAQNHGIYLNNNQRPNYNRPLQSPPPPLPPLYHRPMRPTPPARSPTIYFGGPGGEGGEGAGNGPSPQSNSPIQYASQFSNFLSPLSNLFGGGTSSPSSGSMGTNILQGLQHISRNDDLECVPKVLCQMVGNPERRAQLPSYITSPGLQA